jgi:hypothetical protein
VEKQGFITKSWEVASLAWLRWKRERGSDWVWIVRTRGKGLKERRRRRESPLSWKQEHNLPGEPSYSFVFYLSPRTRPVSQSARRLIQLRSRCVRDGDSILGLGCGDNIHGGPDPSTRASEHHDQCRLAKSCVCYRQHVR